MAARNPSDWNDAATQVGDLIELFGGSTLTDRVFDNALNDLQYFMDAGQLEIMDAFGPLKFTSASYVEVAEYRLIGRNICRGTSLSSCLGYIYCWADDLSTNFTYKITSTIGSDNVELAVSSTQTTKAFRETGAVYISGDTASVETVLLEVKRDAGTGNVWCGGFSLISSVS